MKLMLIGGGEIGKGNTEYETKVIDEEIIKMTNKEKPNLLFIGLASSYSDSYYDIIKKNYTNLGCTTTYLKKKNIINNRKIVEDKINNADIIYIGGGDTLKLLEDVEKYKLDELLVSAAKKNTVIAGISAGAILLSKRGFSDSYILRGEKNTYEFIDGLNLTNLIISPHYKENITKDNELKCKMKDFNVYGISNKSAIKIVDDKIDIIRCSTNNNVYLLSNDNGFIEKEL